MTLLSINTVLTAQDYNWSLNATVDRLKLIEKLVIIGRGGGGSGHKWFYQL